MFTVIGISLVIIVCLIISNNIVINYYTSKQRRFIEYVNKDITLAKIRNEVFTEHRYSLIKNLYFMKKIVNWFLILFIAIVLGLAVFIVINSREYFSEYFEAKRVKLNLQKEEKVDSILNIVKLRTLQVDSLLLDAQLKNKEIESITKQNDELLKHQKSLQYFIDRVKAEEKKNAEIQ
jgi:hypothetical protein